MDALILADAAAEPMSQTTLAIIVGGVCTILTILFRDGGPMIYKLWTKLVTDRGKHITISDKLRKEGQEAVITWLEKRVEELEKHADSQDERINEYQKANQDCLVNAARMELALEYASRKITDLEAWNSRRGESGSTASAAREKINVAAIDAKEVLHVAADVAATKVISVAKDNESK